MHENQCCVKPPLHWIDDHKKDKECEVVMGMMGGWIKVEAHLGIEVKLTICSPPPSACWDDWDVQQHFKDE
jgi:hypothetical protein